MIFCEETIKVVHNKKIKLSFGMHSQLINWIILIIIAKIWENKNKNKNEPTRFYCFIPVKESVVTLF
jgi:hypothetical protein